MMRYERILGFSVFLGKRFSIWGRINFPLFLVGRSFTIHSSSSWQKSKVHTAQCTSVRAAWFYSACHHSFDSIWLTALKLMENWPISESPRARDEFSTKLVISHESLLLIKSNHEICASEGPYTNDLFNFGLIILVRLRRGLFSTWINEDSGRFFTIEFDGSVFDNNMNSVDTLGRF